MSALLKIVQGPNAGAEIALPDGVEITVGAADSCDIVLADPTLPEAPLRLTASPDGTVFALIPPADSPATLETAHVFFYGSSALAVGPSASPWPPLVFPAPPKAEPASPESGAVATSPATAGSAGGSPAKAGAAGAPSAESTSPSAKPSKRARRKRRFLGCLVPLLLLLLLLAILFALFRYLPIPALEPARARVSSFYAERVSPVFQRITFAFSNALPHKKKAQEQPPAPELADFAERYGLTLGGSSARPSLSGNFATRADRLAAAAELYSAFPGVSLDLTDDESLRTAVSDALFTLGESALSVASVSNRVASLSGIAESADSLSAAIDALRADVPRLNGVDTDAVTLRAPVVVAAPVSAPAKRTRAPRTSRAAPKRPDLPVCGILTTPYPCLVLQNGARVFPGALLGDSVVVSIASDSVVLTNANGSFTWKP